MRSACVCAAAACNHASIPHHASCTHASPIDSRPPAPPYLRPHHTEGVATSQPATAVSYSKSSAPYVQLTSYRRVAARQADERKRRGSRPRPGGSKQAAGLSPPGDDRTDEALKARGIPPHVRLWSVSVATAPRSTGLAIRRCSTAQRPKGSAHTILSPRSGARRERRASLGRRSCVEPSVHLAAGPCVPGSVHWPSRP